jgi:23S rRNA (adenine2503-C2)-methyltransferase
VTGGGEPLLVFEAPRRGKPPRHFADLDPDDRAAALAELGQPKFRADQIARQYYGRLSSDPGEWTDLPKALRGEVARHLFPPLLTRVRDQSTDAGETRKSLWRLHDGALVESVLMRYDDRVTMCVSSQAGCGMNCPFCATGQAGLTRNLSTAEIVEQVVAGAREMAVSDIGDTGGGRVSNIVFMGMGEPMANYRAVIAAVRRMTSPAPAGLGISARKITVSTVGLVPRMRQLATEGIPVTLAVSLHAPDDELRDELVPVNNRWPVAEVMDAAWGYVEATGRRVSIEYALIRDINDQQWRAEALADLLTGRLAHVNLIPLNPTPGSKWTASRREDEDAFVATLRRRRIPVSVRDTRGQEIDGACGQLAAVD